MIFVAGFITGFFLCALNALVLAYFLTRHSQTINKSIKTVERQIRGKAVIYEPDEDVERFQSSLKKNEEDTLLTDL